MVRPSGQPKRARFNTPRAIPEDVEAVLQADEDEEAEEDEQSEDVAEDEDDDEEEEEEGLEAVAPAAEEEDNAGEAAEDGGAQITLPTTSQGAAAAVSAPEFAFRLFVRGGLHQPETSASPQAPTKTVFTLDLLRRPRTPAPVVCLQELVDMLVTQQHGQLPYVEV